MGTGVGEERRIIKYLLGQLSEEERAQVEERFFKDEEYEETLRSVENELIDEYVRGLLSDADRESFETFFLISARRRQKVKFARALRRLEGAPMPGVVGLAEERVVEPSAPAEAGRASFLEAWRAIFFTPSFRYAAAALLVALSAAGLWLIADRGRQQNQNEPLQASRNQQPQAVTPSPAAQGQGSSAQATPETVVRAPKELEPPPEVGNGNRVVQPPVPSGRRGPGSVIATISLAPGITRGEGETAQLVLASQTQRVSIRLALEEGDEYPTYRVELRDPAGAVVLTRNLTSARKGEVTLDIPARVLNTGKYELALKGIKGGGRIDDLSFYYLNVRKR